MRTYPEKISIEPLITKNGVLNGLCWSFKNILLIPTIDVENIYKEPKNKDDKSIASETSTLWSIFVKFLLDSSILLPRFVNPSTANRSRDPNIFSKYDVCIIKDLNYV